MKKLVLLIITGFIFTGLTFAQDVQKQDKVGSGDVAKVKSRGADPNIKVEKRLNAKDVKSKAVQPEEKGAKAGARGSGSGSCYTYFENWTSWYIDCYIDGYYEGYIAPWGDGSLTVGSGETCLYAIAEFDDGSRVTWGPVCKYCYYDEFELELYEDYYNWYLR